MIDIHTHIIPQFDDGSKSLEMTRTMLKQHIENGVDIVVATPHQNIRNLNKAIIIEKFNELVNNVKDLPIKLLLGSEIYYYENLIADLKSGKHLTINESKYLLIEFSTINETNIVDIVYDLRMAGYIPIIAHIERYQYLTWQNYLEIKNGGALIQVNAKSFMKKEYLKIIKFLLKNDLIDFIASDCHNDSIRNVDFDYAKKFVLKKYKSSYAKLFNNSNFNFN